MADIANTLKAAWLLSNRGCLRGYQSPKSEMIKVISCTKRKTLRLLKSFFENVFMVPDYELMDSVGGSDVRVDKKQKEITEWQYKGAPSSLVELSAPELIRGQVSFTIYSSPVELEKQPHQSDRSPSPLLRQPTVQLSRQPYPALQQRVRLISAHQPAST